MWGAWGGVTKEKNFANTLTIAYWLKNAILLYDNTLSVKVSVN